MKKLSIISLVALGSIALTSCQTVDNGNSEMDAYVSKLMGQMTLEEKIGQLNLVSNWMYFTNSTFSEEALAIQQIKRGEMGGVYGFTNMEQIRLIQSYAVDSTRLGIPLLFGNDVRG